MSMKIKNRNYNKRKIKLNKINTIYSFTPKKSKYQRLTANSKLTKRSVLVDRKGQLRPTKIAEVTKFLNDQGIVVSIREVELFVKSKYFERNNSVKVYSVLNYYVQTKTTNLVQFFLENMDVDINELANRLDVTVNWLLDENNWNWKLNKNGQRVTPTNLHTTPSGKNVSFEWCYGGGTVVHVS